jgi:hypothetical protein
VILLVAAAITGATLGVMGAWSYGPVAVLIAAPCCGSLAALAAGVAIHFATPGPDLERDKAAELDAMVTALRRAARAGRDDAPSSPDEAVPPAPSSDDRRAS